MAGTGSLTFQPGEFLTGSGRQDSDRMPVAGTPADIMRFMMLGRRKAREYLAKRGSPWFASAVRPPAPELEGSAPTVMKSPPEAAGSPVGIKLLARPGATRVTPLSFAVHVPSSCRSA